MENLKFSIESKEDCIKVGKLYEIFGNSADPIIRIAVLELMVERGLWVMKNLNPDDLTTRRFKNNIKLYQEYIAAIQNLMEEQ